MAMAAKSFPIPVSLAFPEHRVALILGSAAAVLGALFAIVPWSLAAFGAVIALGLSAIENEIFLFAVIFLIPVGWFAKIGLPLGGGAARLDIATTMRLVVVAGFLMGRLLRGQLKMGWLFKHSLTKMSLLLAAAAIASVILGGYGLTYGSLKAIVRLVSYIGFYFFIALWVDSRDRMRTAALLVLGSTILVAVYAIAQELIGDYTSLWLYLNPPEDWFLPMERRPPSFLNYSNSLAGYLNLVIPFALALYILGTGRCKKLGAWSAGLGFVALACTQSTGGLVAFGSVLTLIILFFVRPFKKKVLLLVGLLVLSFAFFAARETLDPAHVGEAVGYDAATRFLLWGTAIDMFVHSPVMGVGWGNFVELYGSYLSAFTFIPPGILGVHNIYLQFLAETGAVGFGTFFVFTFRTVQLAFRQLRRSQDAFDKALAFGVLGAILTVVVHGVVDFLFQVSPQFGTLFWMLLALLVTSTRLQSGRGRNSLSGAPETGQQTA
jgi:putative inorganic carbon (HCO3(-)) transporter